MSAIDKPEPPAPAPRRLRARRSFPTLRTVLALILREMVTTYGRNPGGYAWAVLEPALGTMLVSFVFSLGFKTPSLGSHFGLYFATGILPFAMWNSLTGKVGSAINYSRSLLVYPSVTFLDAIMARFILNTLTELTVSYMVLSFIIVILDVPTAIRADRIALGYAMAMALGLGLGMLNCFIFSMVPVWQRIWGIITRPLFFMSGILFLFDQIPQPFRDWLWWNPLVHVVGAVRSGFYARYDANYVDPVYVFTVSAIMAVTGLLFLRRYYSDIMNT